MLPHPFKNKSIIPKRSMAQFKAHLPDRCKLNKNMADTKTQITNEDQEIQNQTR